MLSGKVVEIDETAVLKAKYQRESILNRPTIWVFGLLEQKTEKVTHFYILLSQNIETADCYVSSCKM